MSSSTNVIVLSSSSPDPVPSQTPAQPKYNPEKLFGLSPLSPSSPPLPSPSELFQPLTRSRFFKAQGAKAAVPSNSKQGSDVVAKPSQRTATRRKETTSATGRSKKSTEDQTKEDTQATIGDSGNAIIKVDEEISKKEPKTRKKRSDAGTKRTQTKNKTITGRVAKSGNTQAEETRHKAEKSVALKPCSKKSNSPKAGDEEIDSLELDVAVKRRLDWTPTKDTSKQVVELDMLDKEDDQNSFGNLLSDYGFSKPSSVVEANSMRLEDGAATKRRRIELVDSRLFPNVKHISPDIGGDASSSESAQASKASASKEKPKKRSKKITTLTGRVTARYVNDSTDDSDTAKAFTAASGDATNNARTDRSGAQQRGDSSSRSHVIESSVLPPEAAVSFLEEQDLVFGTCSQLEREDSPTMLRDIQTAIRASENDMIAEAKASPAIRTSSRFSGRAAISRLATPRNLWSMAARDSDGSLAQIEVLDMVNVSDKSGLPHKPSDYLRSMATLTEETGSKATRTDNLIQEQSTTPADNLSNNEKPVTNYPESSTKVDCQLKEIVQEASTASHMSRYANLTDSQLSKEVKNFGFKPMKSRKKMIEVLEKCWESKQRATKPENQDMGENVHISSRGESDATQAQAKKRTRKTTRSPKTQRTRTKSKVEPKTSAICEKEQEQGANESSQPSNLSFANVEVIEDSEDELIPSPSRLQNRYTLNPPEIRGSQSLPVSDTPSSRPRKNSVPRIKSVTSDTIAERSIPDLASQINKAVRAQPRSSSAGCKRPSWLEKILMYDPIILEDFATWLNTEGLGLVHEDREVSAGVLREWCETNGICCCFRKNSK